jgi:hypothetical protein
MIPSASTSATDPLLAGLPIPAAAAPTTTTGEAATIDFSLVFGQLAPPAVPSLAVLPNGEASVPVPNCLGFALAVAEAGGDGGAGECGVADTRVNEPATGTQTPGPGGLLVATAGTGTGHRTGGSIAATSLPSTAKSPAVPRVTLIHAKAIGRVETSPAATGDGRAISPGASGEILPGMAPVGFAGVETETVETGVAVERGNPCLTGLSTGAGPLAGGAVGSPDQMVVPPESVPAGESAGEAEVFAVATATRPAHGGQAMSGAIRSEPGEHGLSSSALPAFRPTRFGGEDETVTPAPGGSMGFVSPPAPRVATEFTAGGHRMVDVARAWAATAAPAMAAGGAGNSGLPDPATMPTGTGLPIGQPSTQAEEGLLPLRPLPGEATGDAAVPVASDLAPELVTRTAAFQVHAVAAGATPTDRGEKIALRRPAVSERADKPMQGVLKTTEDVGLKQGERQVAIAGIDGANRDPAMPFPPPELVVPTVFTASNALRGAGDHGVMEETRQPELGTQAARAVEAVCTAAELAQRDGRGSLTLRFALGEADLSVRVEVKEHEVRATFSTESAELRQALSHECAAAAESVGRSFRLTAQITDQGGAAAGGAPFSGDSGFARREPHHPPQAPELARLATPSRAAHDEPRAAVATSLSAAFSGQAQHLHTLA